MLIEALTGGAIGLGFALFFWFAVRTDLQRLNQGMFTSLGLALMVGACLWWDGWILTALAGFVVSVAALTRL